MGRWVRSAGKDDLKLENVIDTKTRRNFLRRLIDDEEKRNGDGTVSVEFLLDILLKGWLTRHEINIFNQVIPQILQQIYPIQILNLLDEGIITKDNADFYKLALEMMLSKNTDSEFINRRAFEYFLSGLDLFNKNDKVYKLMQQFLTENEDINNI